MSGGSGFYDGLACLGDSAKYPQERDIVGEYPVFLENRIRHGLLGGYLQGGCWIDDGRLFPPPEELLVG